MPNLKLLLSITFFIGNLILGLSQELPPIREFSPNDYKADNKNWAITQTENGYIFAANNKGILRFNGTEWDLFPSPNKSIIRSVKAVGDKVFSGAYMEFGVWEKDENERYHYQSLSDTLSLLEDEQFWNIIGLTEDMVAFQSLNRIYLFNLQTGAYRLIEAEDGINKIFLIDKILYYQKINEGIFKVIDGEERAVSQAEPFQENLVVAVYKLDNGLYAQTQNEGIFSLEDGHAYKPEKYRELWEEISVYNSIQADDGAIYLGTIAHGLLKLGEEGVVYQIDRENGLSNNTVLSLFEDHNGNIWMGLDNGINYINNNPVFKVFHDYKGLLGTVYAAIKFKDILYVGTNQGLFWYDTEKGYFSRISETKGQVWSLFTDGETLFCGHNNGTYLVEHDHAYRIGEVQGTWNFKKLGDYIIQGNYEGLHLLKKTNGTWDYFRKIEGFAISTKYFEFINERELLVNHEYKGVFKLKLNDGLTEVVAVNKEKSVPKGLYSSLINYQNELFYAYKNGIFSYNPEEEKFERDAALSKLYENGEYSSGRLIKDQNGNVWAFTKSDLIRVLPSSVKGERQIHKLPIPSEIRSQITGDENVSLIGPNKYLFGNTKGYFTVDLAHYTEPQPEIEINKIYDRSTEGEKHLHLYGENPVIPYKQNSLEFNLSSINYEPFYKTEYQHILEGVDDEWSEWTTSSKVDYQKLGYGKYTFNARSRIGTDNVSEMKSFPFTIKRPFYLTRFMLVLYVLIFLSLVFVTHMLYKNYYKKKERLFQLRAERELRMKETEAQHKIIQIKNEQLKQDIDSKNRELAISTMSLIKKNEFLSHLKNDLSGIDPKNSKLKKVIHIINKNINSSDDWEFFEKAFNNADKDFFKKIKKEHPTLTPDDLKLCAYLRLNLSSKEIAPLFNISTRSVEVKRYRLRKKMNLSKEQNLIEYMLSI